MIATAARPAWRWPDTCTIEHDFGAADEDAWGNPAVPDWQPSLEDVPCRTWVDAGREPVGSDRTIAVVDRRMIVPRGVDVTTRDRVTAIVQRGETLAGLWGVEAVLERRSHQELVLQEVI